MRDLVLLLTSGVLIVALLIYLGQRRIIFPAPEVGAPLFLEEGIDPIELDLGRAYLGLPIDTVAEDGGAPLMVYAHGNAEVAHWSFKLFHFFRTQGFAVLFLEYPGYAGSPGSPSSDSIEESALQALDIVVARNDINAARVVPYGRSIGSGVACILAAKRPVAALVLESAFTTLHELATDHNMPGFLLRDEFDNAGIVAELDVPVFIYHGKQDQIIPFSHGQRLAERASNATTLWRDCGHNDCLRPGQPLYRFFQKNGLMRPEPGVELN